MYLQTHIYKRENNLRIKRRKRKRKKNPNNENRKNIKKNCSFHNLFSFQTDNQHASYAGEKRRERKIVDASSGLLFLKDHFL